MDLGQIYICGISGLTLTEDESSFLKNEKIGGVILFSRNYESPVQLANLVNSINNCQNGHPLFISVDQEGGRVQRFKGDFTHFPAMLDIADLESPKLIYEVHQMMAKELKACGINLSFSPVCDVLVDPDNEVIGDRAFGRDAETVSKMVSGALRGYRTENLFGCAKHFPGHGDTAVDSHFELPLVKTDRKTINEREFKAFYKAIRSKLQFMMISHVVLECIDDKYPSSLSKKVIDVLKKELNFPGIIVSDDMEMHAITKHFGVEQSSKLAIEAGVDLLVYRTMGEAKRSLDAVKEFCSKDDKFKTIVEKRLHALNLFKEEYFPPETLEINPYEVSEQFPFQEHSQYAQELRLKIGS